MTKSDIVANVVATPNATWIGCGYAPPAPGTAGSAAALLMAAGLHAWLGWPPFWFAILAAALLAPGIWSAGVMARVEGRNDPSILVVDEVIGQWITIPPPPPINSKTIPPPLLPS